MLVCYGNESGLPYYHNSGKNTPLAVLCHNNSCCNASKTIKVLKTPRECLPEVKLTKYIMQ